MPEPVVGIRVAKDRPLSDADGAAKACSPCRGPKARRMGVFCGAHESNRWEATSISEDGAVFDEGRAGLSTTRIKRY